MSMLPDNMISHTSQFTVALPNPAASNPCVRRWNRKDYHRLGEQGWFRDQKVELIDGEILVLTPQTSWHAYALDKTAELLNTVFARDHWIRLQLPLVSGEYGEPEPDISVVRGVRENFIDRHPTSAALIVEISYSTQDYDTKTKAHLYASMAVPDYWVLDLENRQLFVYRQPTADASVPFGHRYQQVETLSAGGQVSPLEKPDSQIAIADMLPPKK